jgi:hypothetical protein
VLVFWVENVGRDLNKEHFAEHVCFLQLFDVCQCRKLGINTSELSKRLLHLFTVNVERHALNHKEIVNTSEPIKSSRIP